jgi:N utilization substance protein A
LEKVSDIIDAIAHEKGLKQDDVKEALKTAITRTAKRVINRDYEFDVDFEDGQLTQVFQIITVVENDDERLEENPEAFVPLEEALEIDSDFEVGDEMRYEHELLEYGRSAASAMHQEIEYHVQRLVETNLYEKYKSKVGTIFTGRVVRVDNKGNTFIEMDEVRGVLPFKSRIKGESFRVGDIVKSVLRYVNISKEEGIKVELSRTSPKFLEELLRLEVPEIKDELVVIEKSARIPGRRAKIALLSTSPQIDPVGATVGVKGVRINAVSAEIENESIDCIEYTSIPEMFVARSLSPAIIDNVTIEGEDKAIVVISSDQKSKAIGTAGINIRLASMLTGFEIELQEKEGSSETTTDGMNTQEEEKKVSASDALSALFND